MLVAQSNFGDEAPDDGSLPLDPFHMGLLCVQETSFNHATCDTGKWRDHAEIMQN